MQPVVPRRHCRACGAYPAPATCDHDARHDAYDVAFVCGLCEWRTPDRLALIQHMKQHAPVSLCSPDHGRADVERLGPAPQTPTNVQHGRRRPRPRATASTWDCIQAAAQREQQRLSRPAPVPVPAPVPAPALAPVPCGNEGRVVQRRVSWGISLRFWSILLLLLVVLCWLRC